MAIKTDFFLGANTPLGFVSLFDELYDPYKKGRMYIIKGGPGCGKSTFMKDIARKAQDLGYDTEMIYCSSDPQSLDAVRIPELSFCICDGTSPHIVEPRFPGACENIINLGSFWSEKGLGEDADEIRRLTLENSIYHRRSTRFLNAAGSLTEETLRLTADSIFEEKLNGYAIRFCSRELPRKKGSAPGRKSVCFLSGITPDGVVYFENTLSALSSRIIAVEDEYSLASGMLVERIGERAVASGYDVIFCRCPMKPKGFCEHIIIPEASISVVTKKTNHPISLEVSRTIHARRFMNGEKLSVCKRRLAFNKKIIGELISQSVLMLQKAKQTHDMLEEYYIKRMDFEAKAQFCNEFINGIFNEGEPTL